MVTGRVPFEAANPSDVMRKHLKEQLVPPDHINTSLSAGVSEMIETMMAKDRNDRYSTVQELLLDLTAVRNGEPPLQARKKFQIDALEKLQEGVAVETEAKPRTYTEETIMKYRMVMLGLGALSMVLVVVIFFLISRS
jgi:serine/threonine-protein kinase